MIVHIIEKDKEIPLITYCKRKKLSFMNVCLRYCSGESFEDILGLNPEQIKIILFKDEEEIKNA